MEQITELAEHILNSKSFSDNTNEELESLLKAEILLEKLFGQAIKEKNFEVYEIEPVRQALDRSKKDITQYTNQFVGMIKKREDEIRAIDNKEAIIHEHNQDVRYHTYDLEQELAKLGFFDGERKKEIQAELAKWKRKEVPPEYEQKRQELKSIIKQCEAHIAPFQDKVKGIVFYELEAERHFDSIQWEKKQQRSHTRSQEPRERKSVREELSRKQEQIKAQQEARKAPSEAPTVKGLKEVHQPNLKPLKRL